MEVVTRTIGGLLELNWPPDEYVAEVVAGGD
jgi:hypothetical protein